MRQAKDALETWPRPDRVFYAEGVLLDADDFGAEQTYHRGRMARLLTILGSGTAMGLRVSVDPAAAAAEEERRRQQLIVEPGLAIDRLGRLIEVPRPACIRLERWLDERQAAWGDAFHAGVPINDPPIDGEAAATMDGIVLDVYLQFVECEVGRTPAFATGPFDALDAVQPSRLRDAYRLGLRLCPEDDLDATLPQPIWSGDRAAVQRHLIEEAWQQLTARDDDTGAPVPLPGHPDDQDPTSVFLARVVVEAVRSPDGAVARAAGGAAACRNYARRFVYPLGALTHLLRS